MSCGTHCCAAQSQFDSKRAARDLRQYRRKGADAVTRLIIAELEQRPMQGRELLDVGAGIGVIGAELAKTGVTKATLVDASPAYLETARKEVGSRYGQGHTQFVLGDFALIAATLADADVVTLGRVVCCYPDAEMLLRAAAARSRWILGFTYPRYRWFVRLVNTVQNLLRQLTGNSFRTYIHVPGRMKSVLQTEGMALVAQRGTSVWMLDLYERVHTKKQESDRRKQ